MFKLTLCQCCGRCDRSRGAPDILWTWRFLCRRDRWVARSFSDRLWDLARQFNGRLGRHARRLIRLVCLGRGWFVRVPRGLFQRFFSQFLPTAAISKAKKDKTAENSKVRYDSGKKTNLTAKKDSSINQSINRPVNKTIYQLVTSHHTP